MSQFVLSQRQSGGVLTEFVIVIPMLLVFFVGIMSAGQMLGQLSWLSQATYIGAVSGTSSATTNVQDTIKNNIERLRDLQSLRQVDTDSTWQVHSTISNGTFSGKPIVTVDVTAHVSPLMQSFIPTNLGASAAAAYLVPNPAQFASLNNFANPSGLSGCPIGGCPAAVNPPPKWYFGGYSANSNTDYLDYLMSEGKLDKEGALKTLDLLSKYNEMLKAGDPAAEKYAAMLPAELIKDAGLKLPQDEGLTATDETLENIVIDFK